MRLSVFSSLATVLLVVVALPQPHRRLEATVQGEAPALVDLLARTAAYLDEYERKIPTVIADEEYRQGGLGSVRIVRSDVMMIDLGNSQWVWFRDAFELNNQPVRDHVARLKALLDGPSSELVQKAQRIADESGRYNTGIERNINVPTMALTYVSRANQPRSTFQLAGTASVHGVHATIVSFKETASPPLIHTTHGTVETSGRFWLATDTGAVLKTALAVKIPPSADVPKDKSLDGEVTVEYGNDSHAPVLVPLRMDEHYESPRGVTGQATYSHFQEFSVTVIVRAPGGH